MERIAIKKTTKHLLSLYGTAYFIRILVNGLCWLHLACGHVDMWACDLFVSLYLLSSSGETRYQLFK